MEVLWRAVQVWSRYRNKPVLIVELLISYKWVGQRSVGSRRSALHVLFTGVHLFQPFNSSNFKAVWFLRARCLTPNDAFQSQFPGPTSRRVLKLKCDYYSISPTLQFPCKIFYDSSFSASMSEVWHLKRVWSLMTIDPHLNELLRTFTWSIMVFSIYLKRPHHIKTG